MNSFDSIKFEIPEYIVQNWNNDYFDTIERTNNLTGLIETYQQTGNNSKALPVGIGQIIYSEGKFIISISAKILKDNYLKGINKNTIEQVIKSIQPIIKFDANDFLDNGIKVRTIDVTNNIEVKNIGSRHQCIFAINNSVKNGKYKSEIYKSKKTEGVVIWGNHKKKHRLIAYNKCLELLDKKNEAFIQSLKNPQLLFSSAEKILRIETNFVNLEMIRKFITGTNNLTDLRTCLNSNFTTNYNFLTHIVANGNRQLTIYDIMNNVIDTSLTGSELLNQIAIDFIIKDCKFDEKSIKIVLTKIFPNKNTLAYHWAKKENNIKSRIHKLQFENQSCTNNNQTILSQILTELENQ